MMKLPARAIINDPSLMKYVRKRSREEPPRDTIKAQVRIVREVYRALLKDAPVLANIAYLEDLFDNLPENVVKFALFIEQNTSVLPDNPFPAWVTVPKSEVKSLITSIVQTIPDRLSLYTYLGIYLWMRLKGYRSSEHSSFEFSLRKVSDLYRTMQVSADIANRRLKKFNISLSEKRSVVGDTFDVVSRVSIPSESPIFDCIHNEYTLERQIISKSPDIKLVIPELINIMARLTTYQLVYPVDNTGLPNVRVPVFFDDGDSITVPLTKSICPILIAALFTPKELSALYLQSKAKNRLSLIRTIYRNASKATNRIDTDLIHFNQILGSGSLLHSDNRLTFLHILNRMNHSGVRVDIELLKSVKLNDRGLKPSQIRSLENQRESIDRHLSGSDNRLFSKYRLESQSERAYSERYNIQSYPTVFKEAIIPDEGCRLVYVDVVANDLSILINLANDQNGLEILRRGGDPYHILAKEVNPSLPERNKVKLFINPWLNGASTRGIVKASKGLLNVSDVRSLKRAVRTLFPSADNWINSIRQQAKSSGVIPGDFNPLEGQDVPIPKKLGQTVAPAFIIQRFGSALFRSIIVRLWELDIVPSIFIHDSVLLHSSSSVSMDVCRETIRSVVQRVLLNKKLKVLAISFGVGSNWAEAEDSAKRYFIER